MVASPNLLSRLTISISINISISTNTSLFTSAPHLLSSTHQHIQPWPHSMSSHRNIRPACNSSPLPPLTLRSPHPAVLTMLCGMYFAMLDAPPPCCRAGNQLLLLLLRDFNVGRQREGSTHPQHCTSRDGHAWHCRHVRPQCMLTMLTPCRRNCFDRIAVPPNPKAAASQPTVRQASQEISYRCTVRGDRCKQSSRLMRLRPHSPFFAASLDRLLACRSLLRSRAACSFDGG